MTAIAVTSELTTRPVTSTQEANGLATTLNPSNTAGTVGGAVGGVIVMLLVIIIVTVIIVVLLKRNGQSRKVNGTEEQAASRYVDGVLYLVMIVAMMNTFSYHNLKCIPLRLQIGSSKISFKISGGYPGGFQGYSRTPYKSTDHQD